MGNFGCIHAGIMHPNFQASSFTGVGGELGDRRMREVTPQPYTKFLNSPFASLRRKLTRIPWAWDCSIFQKKYKIKVVWHPKMKARKNDKGK